MKFIKARYALILFLGLASTIVSAQISSIQTRATGSAPGRADAPIDLTGNWVSIVSEDWRWRMVTPLIGDFANIPENEAAREIATAWRPEMNVGNECIAYGAPGIMHRPGRIKISWEDDLTLKMEFDAGMQTRMFYFDETVAAGAPSRQGHTLAKWEDAPAPATFNGIRIGQTPRVGTSTRSLEAVTSNLVSGYLRKNGMPHSDQTKVTEYFDVFETPAGVAWFVDTIIVEDPTYLVEPWVTTMHFMKETDDSKWNPQECFVMHENGF
ncbi:MAG: hypothetical protein COA71_03855 [SAR86 cluster bacterium]|uniref:Uncharacterized protein n=1 Tax=SAR86 cluster bacterium TaxID=2030880 RepID=A0A2A5CGQ8_9GAMM|nr:hypothetical protein [Gammaproteobacteria bacterium AH-315-E17]PCJ42650.1 MAG: hypothetical protein COA71_03855 [SAR86 cluster bacterium]